MNRRVAVSGGKGGQAAWPMRFEEYPAEVMIRLCAQGYAQAPPDTVIIAAHPDDEVMGAGGRLKRLAGAAFIHTTDGAPLDMADAVAAGFKTRRGYAHARRKELLSALSLAGIKKEQCFELGAIDKQASLSLHGLTAALAEFLGKTRPEVVITHPYEGGHPDHDATAFAVHAASRLLEGEGIMPPVIIEFTSYHARDGRLSTGGFLPFDTESFTVILNEEERELKKSMLECFFTQRRNIPSFLYDFERFRLAPRYDFTLPPHHGRLLYEQSSVFEMTGARWRGLAREAMEGFGLSGTF